MLFLHQYLPFSRFIQFIQYLRFFKVFYVLMLRHLMFNFWLNFLKKYLNGTLFFRVFCLRKDSNFYLGNLLPIWTSDQPFRSPKQKKAGSNPFTFTRKSKKPVFFYNRLQNNYTFWVILLILRFHLTNL